MPFQFAGVSGGCPLSVCGPLRWSQRGVFKAAVGVRRSETSQLPLSVSAETHHPFIKEVQSRKVAV